MRDKLYGIDYDTYACGGLGTAKIMKIGCETVLFYTESEMLNALAELKTNNVNNNTIREIKLFVTPICRMEYRI